MVAKPIVPLVALALASAALAGCIGKGGEDPVDDPSLDESQAPVINSTDTPDGRGEISAFKETNATEKGKGGMEHAHDYWGSEGRKVIYQEDLGLIPLPLTPDGGYPPGTSIADFNIPAPNLVYEGTSQLELLFHNVCVLYTGGAEGVANPAGCTASPTVKVLVDYLTAADDPGEWRQAGQVTPEQPLIIPVKPLEADMPHQVASLWLFRIYTEQADAFEFNLTVTAVKGYDVVKWPPHPDLYAKGPERVIYDGPWETKINDAATFFLTGTDTNWFYPEKVISYGTERLVVDVTGLTYAAGNPASPPPLTFYLDYYNASFSPKIGNGGTSGGSARDEASDGTAFHFEIPVTEYGYDSPYQTHSRWGFRMLAEYEDQYTDPLGGWSDSLVCPDCYQATISYNLKIVAVGHSTADEGIDMMDPALREDGNATAEEPQGGERSNAAAPSAPSTPLGDFIARAE